MPSKALVIGGAGFIGSALCRALLQRKIPTTSLDSYSTGSTDNHVKGVEYIKGDARWCDIMAGLMGAGFDLVFHFGEYARVEASFKNEREVFTNNLSGIYPVLRLVKENNAKLIYSSSSSLFSRYSADDISPYTYVKGITTEIIKQYAEWHDIKYAVCYFFNAYGPGEIGTGEYATVVAKYIELRQQGKETAPVVAPGTQQRNFTHVDDIVSGVLAVADFGNGDNYEIGSDEAWSILQLAEMIGLKPEIKPSARGNRLTTKLDTSRIRALGWRPQNSLGGYLRSLGIMSDKQMVVNTVDQIAGER